MVAGSNPAPGARSSVVEHPTFNRMVDGSNPSGRTTTSLDTPPAQLFDVRCAPLDWTWSLRPWEAGAWAIAARRQRLPLVCRTAHRLGRGCHRRQSSHQGVPGLPSQKQNLFRATFKSPLQWRVQLSLWALAQVRVTERTLPGHPPAQAMGTSGRPPPAIARIG